MYHSSNECKNLLWNIAWMLGIVSLIRMFYLSSQFDCYITEFFNNKLCFIKTEVREEQCMTVEFVKELLNIRDGVMKVSDMNVDEVQDIIDYVTAK